MKEKLKTKRIDIYISVILSLIVGVLFIIFPVGMESVLAVIIGVVVLLIAVVMLIGAFISGVGNAIFGIIISLLLGFLGVWIIVNPVDFAMIMYIAIGIMMTIHGISSFVSSFTVKNMGVGTWWLMLIGAIISIVLGIVCICCSFGVIVVSGILTGVMLIIDAIVTFIVNIRTSKYKTNAAGEKVVDSKVID